MQSKRALLALALVGITCAAGLSWPVCDQYEMAWSTDTPHLTGHYPFYNLILTCRGNLNVEGNPLDICYDTGRFCGEALATAFCQYIGFDGSVPGTSVVVQASGPVRALSGEWCVSPGRYLTASNITSASQIRKVEPTPCSRLDAVTCYRRREQMAAFLLTHLQPSPSIPVVPTSVNQVNPTTAGGTGQIVSASTGR